MAKAATVTPRGTLSARVDNDLLRIEAKIDGLLRVADLLIRTQAQFVEMAKALIEGQAAVKASHPSAMVTSLQPVHIQETPATSVVPGVSQAGGDARRVISNFSNAVDVLTAAQSGVVPDINAILPTNPLPGPPTYVAPQEMDEPEEEAPRPSSLSDIRALLADELEEEGLLPEPDTDDVWRRRLTMYRQMKLWAPEWGPLPGHEGCLAPAGL